MTKVSKKSQTKQSCKTGVNRIYIMDIQKIFDKVSNREIAYTYIIKKVAETPVKKDRLEIVESLIDFLQNEQDNLQKVKIYNINCDKCKSSVDPETGVCGNCG